MPGPRLDKSALMALRLRVMQPGSGIPRAQTQLTVQGRSRLWIHTRLTSSRAERDRFVRDATVAKKWHGAPRCGAQRRIRARSSAGRFPAGRSLEGDGRRGWVIGYADGRPAMGCRCLVSGGCCGWSSCPQSQQVVPRQSGTAAFTAKRTMDATGLRRPRADAGRSGAGGLLQQTRRSRKDSLLVLSYPASGGDGG